MSFSISNVWRDTTADVASYASRYALPAAAFFFLPQLAAALLAPSPEVWQDFARYEVALPLLAVSLVSLFGQIVIILLALDPNRGEGAAMRHAPAFYLTALIILLLGGLAILSGLMLLLLPGLFFAARLLLALPSYIAAGSTITGSLERSWTLTAGWKIWLPVMGALAILALFILIASGVATAVGSLVDGKEPGLVTAALASIVSAIFAVYYNVFQTKLYLALR